MSDVRVSRFNHIVGNTPVHLNEDREEFWKKVKLQADLIVEEALELQAAAKNRDIVEVVDGNVDVWYLREYMDDLLTAADVNVSFAKSEVCKNNDQKFTTSKGLAVESFKMFQDQGIDVVIVPVFFENELYYVVKRCSDGKVMKLVGHQRPRLEMAVTERTKEFVGDKNED